MKKAVWVWGLCLVSVWMSSCGVLYDVDLTASPTSGTAPLAVAFTADTDGYIGLVNYFWDFGDGDVSYEQNPSHTFSEPGVYSVICEAANTENTVRSSIEIVVNE